jgi:tyrosine aminotransferase
MTAENGGATWSINSSIVAQRTSNPIRKVVEQLNVKPNPELEPISLSIGDPTLYGNLPPPPIALDGVQNAVKQCNRNGYPHSSGYEDCRAAVAKSCSTENQSYTANDIVLASGCSGALEMSIQVLANEGDNILVPRPGFSLYQTLCDSKGIECKHYNLLPENGWECDIDHMRSLIDCKTKAILINNPSNPCGSVYSIAHLKSIVQLANQKKIPIISDEIYAHMGFSGSPFHSISTIATDVPALICGGIAKRYMVPGWRLGWTVIHDPIGAFGKIRAGLAALSTLILGPNSIAQSVLPDLLLSTPQEYYASSLAELQRNAEFSYERIRSMKGLGAIQPQGAMYMMIKVNVDNLVGVEDDIEFTRKLLAEQAVSVLPGSCFGLKNYFRIVICAPIDKLTVAFDRIEQFCQEHAENPSKKARS